MRNMDNELKHPTQFDQKDMVQIAPLENRETDALFEEFDFLRDSLDELLENKTQGSCLDNGVFFVFF